MLTLGLIPSRLELYRADLLRMIRKEAPSEPYVDGVLLSHIHYDHSANISYLDERVPIYSSKITELYAKTLIETGTRNIETEIHNFKPRPLLNQQASPVARVFKAFDLGAEFQLMTYHELLRRLRAEPLHLREVLKFRGLNERSLITDELLAQLEPHQYPAERNITKLGRMVVRAAKSIPNLSKDLEVIYESQQTGKIIGRHRFQFSEKAWKEDLRFASQYWLGKRPAQPVNEANRWKCAFCEFKEGSICPLW